MTPSPRTLKRFYEQAGTVAGPGGISVALDGRPIRTPAGRVLEVPTHALGAAIADEWARQGEQVDPEQLPLTRLANVALDRTPDRRVEIIQEISRVCETDLVCHIAPEPAGLRQRQLRGWEPWRRWAADQLGIALDPVSGLLGQGQPAESLVKAAELASSLDDFTITGVAFGCGLYASSVLSFAVAMGGLDAAEAFDLSRIEDAWQTEHWGEDSEAARAVAARRRDAVALGIWFAALSR